MRVKEFYERMYADSYETVKLPFLYRKLKRFELKRNDLVFKNISGGNKILEIGCGEGELLFKLRKRYKELWGIDISEIQIKNTKKRVRAIKNIHVKVGDANKKLEFKDFFFDIIIAIEVLEHLFDPYHFMEECRRLLKSKGTLIVHVPNVAFFPNRLRLFFGKELRTSEGGDWKVGHLHYFTKYSLKKLFEDEGFRVLKITHGGIFYKLRRWWGSLLCGDILVIGVKNRK